MTQGMRPVSIRTTGRGAAATTGNFGGRPFTTAPGAGGARYVGLIVVDPMMSRRKIWSPRLARLGCFERSCGESREPESVCAQKHGGRKLYTYSALALAVEA
jgi:hypothetical protein